MKRILAFATALLFLAACNNQQNETAENSNHAMPEAGAQAPEENKYANVQFALDKDPVCQMPLTAGIADTAVIDGKIYGFCATECKDTYIKEHRH